MAFLIEDRVLETCSSPGTGAVTLLGAVTGYQSFSTAFSSTNGTTTYYCIADQGGANWEVGIGTWNTGNTLSRTTVLSSSNAGATVNFASGTQNVFVTYPTERAVYVDSTNSFVTVPSIQNTPIGSTTANTGAFTNLSASGTVTFTGTGAAQLPSGTTAQEPSSPVEGMIRYNTTTKQFEGYSEVASVAGWYSVGGSSITNDTTTSTAVYPLFAHATSGTAQVVYTSNSNYLYTPSTGLLQAPFHTATGTITGSSTTGAFNYGTLSYSDVNIFGSFTSSVNTYNQIILQNTNSGSAASTDYVVSNNNGTATTYYGDYGMNSSGWTGTAGTNSFNAPNMVYLTSTTADLLIGTTTSNLIRFATNGGADALQVTAAGNVTATNQLQGAEVYASNGVMAMASTVTSNYTVPSGANVITVGPWSVASGVTFTLPSGSRQVIL